MREWKTDCRHRTIMDCVTTSRIVHQCYVCRLFFRETHLVGAERYCGRHCPVHEEAPHQPLAAEPVRELIAA